MSAPLLAQVDVRGDRAFVTALAEAPNGMWKVQDWVREARADASPDELGRLVEAALARSAEGDDGADGNPLTPLLRAAGVSSWARYVKGLSSVSVEREKRKTKVLPMRNLGVREGLDELQDEAVILGDPDPESLGEAVKRALERSRAATA